MKANHFGYTRPTFSIDWLQVAYAFFIAGVIGDILTTRFGLWLGLQEGNVIVATLMELTTPLIGLLIVKVFATLAAISILYVVYRVFDEDGERLGKILMFGGLGFIFLLATVNNSYLISSLIF